MLKSFFDEEEYINATKQLQNFLEEKFGEKYKIAYKLYLNKLAREMGYEDYNDLLESKIKRNQNIKSEKEINE